MTCPRTLYVVSSLVRIFPDKPKPEYKALRESISRLGLLDPILMWRGMVVDGCHRLRACLELDVEPRFDVLSADADPMEIVVDRMGTQWHLNETARAAAAVRAIGKPKPGRPKGSRKNRANLPGFRTRRWALLFHSLLSRDLDHKESVRLSKPMCEYCLNLVRQMLVLELAGDLSRLEGCRRVLPRLGFELHHATIKV